MVPVHARITIQNSEVNKVWNVNIIQKTITKSSVGQHGPPKNAKARRSVHPLLTGHTRRAPFVEIRYAGLPVVTASVEMIV